MPFLYRIVRARDEFGQCLRNVDVYQAVSPGSDEKQLCFSCRVIFWPASVSVVDFDAGWRTPRSPETSLDGLEALVQRLGYGLGDTPISAMSVEHFFERFPDVKCWNNSALPLVRRTEHDGLGLVSTSVLELDGCHQPPGTTAVSKLNLYPIAITYILSSRTSWQRLQHADESSNVSFVPVRPLALGFTHGVDVLQSSHLPLDVIEWSEEAHMGQGQDSLYVCTRIQCQHPFGRFRTHSTQDVKISPVLTPQPRQHHL